MERQAISVTETSSCPNTTRTRASRSTAAVEGPEDLDWGRILLEAAEKWGVPEVPAVPLLATPWGGALPGVVKEPAPLKHDLFAAQVMGLTAKVCPWLPDLLGRARALVVVSPGHYFFFVPQTMGAKEVHIPQLTSLTLVPAFVNAGTTFH